MKIEDFEKLAEELKTRPVPGKRLFVWSGTKEKLYEHLPKEIVRELALSQLPVPDESLASETNIQKGIKKALKKELEDYFAQLKNQQILVVSDAELIARYNTGLGPFYDCYIGDRTMVVLIVPAIEDIRNMNSLDYVEVNESATLRFFQNVLGEEGIIRR